MYAFSMFGLSMGWAAFGPLFDSFIFGHRLCAHDFLGFRNRGLHRPFMWRSTKARARPHVVGARLGVYRRKGYRNAARQPAAKPPTTP
jgi:hypothetical protein